MNLLFSQFNNKGAVGGSSSSHGGCSPAPFASLNVSYGVGDLPENVCANRQGIKTALGADFLLSARQVHGQRIFCLFDSLTDDLEVDGYDALITNRPGVGLMIQQADCQAVMLYDSRRQVIANIHSGWRGSALNVIAKTIEKMKVEFGSMPSDLSASISPSLGPCCAEFVNYRAELPAAFWPYQVRDNYFDFWAISRDQLSTAGVPEDSIKVAGICTVCNHDYFSYRREGTTGRCATVIVFDKCVETVFSRQDAKTPR